jgi:integrase
MCDPYLTYYAHTIDKRLHLRVWAFFIRTQHKSKSPGGLGLVRSTVAMLVSPTKRRPFRLKWAITKERPAARHGHRDATMILVAYRHGLRATELCDLQWHQIELDQGRLHVRRAKRGTPSVHPIRGDEIRALRRLRREHVSEAYVFISEPRRAHEHARLPSPHSKARQDRRDALCGPSAHVAARLRLQAGQ